MKNEEIITEVFDTLEAESFKLTKEEYLDVLRRVSFKCDKMAADLEEELEEEKQ